MVSTRRSRFSPDFTANLDALLYHLLFEKTRTLSLKSLSFYAVFLKNLLSLMDRGFVFNVIYQKVTGRSFVKPRAERREARKRRKVVLWEYKRDG